MNDSFLRDVEIVSEAYALAEKYMDMDMFEDALQIYNKSLDVALKHKSKLNEKLQLLIASTGYGKLKALYYLERYEEAIEFYNFVFIYGSWRTDIKLVKGHCLVSLNKLQEALDFYNSLYEIKEDPYLNPSLVYEKAVVLYKLDRYKECEDTINISIRGFIYNIFLEENELEVEKLKNYIDEYNPASGVNSFNFEMLGTAYFIRGLVLNKQDKLFLAQDSFIKASLGGYERADLFLSTNY